MFAAVGLLLKEYKAKFAGSPVSATYTYLKQVLSNNLPANPLVAHETDWNRLRDPAFLDATLRCSPALHKPDCTNVSPRSARCSTENGL